MKKFRVLDLFSGIGGFSRGLERAGGFETVAFCEIEEYPRKVLAKHWPGVPIYEDVRTLTADTLSRDGIAVDVICGGFPCQPFSTASRGRRTAADDMWHEMRRIIRETKPKLVLCENVQELPIKRAAHHLEGLGYRGRPRRIGAHDIGADHVRSRWWLCSHANDEGKLHSAINAEVARMSALRSGVWGWPNYAGAIRVSDGLPNRVDRLKGLGNAVVPQIPELIGRAIMQAEGMTKFIEAAE